MAQYRPENMTEKKNDNKDQDKRQKLRQETNKGNILKYVSQFEL